MKDFKFIDNLIKLELDRGESTGLYKGEYKGRRLEEQEEEEALQFEWELKEYAADHITF